MSETHSDSLISQTIDGDITDEQWNQFVDLAERDPALWRRMAEAQRDHSALSRALEAACEASESIAAADTFSAVKCTGWPDGSAGPRRAGAWSGWAAAAMVAITAGAYVNSLHVRKSNVARVDPPATHQTGFASAAEALQAYLARGAESGDVLGEVPTKVLVRSQPSQEGQGIEVVYIRQILERTVVPDLYQITGRNESGEAMLVPYRRPVGEPM